jgi:hypothetical protein
VVSIQLPPTQVCIGARIKPFGDRPIHYSSGSVKYLVAAD